MKKIIKDRLNMRKSQLQQLKHRKLDKYLDEDRILVLESLVEELEWLLEKGDKENI